MSLLGPRPLEAAKTLPAVHLRSVTTHPLIFRKMVGTVDGHAQPGDLVTVWTPEGALWGHGLYNPRAEIAVRMLNRSQPAPDLDFWTSRLDRALQLRRELLRLDDVTDACRLVHSEGDGLSGLVVDRFGDVLSAEVFSLAMYQRTPALLQVLADRLGTRHTITRIAPQTHGQEGFLAEPVSSAGAPAEVVVQEHGTKFKVNFADGHKTGFFCDQRENRARLAEFCRDKTVLDLCCYSGGFAVQAQKLGRAREVTGVDLDEDAIALAKENARLNNARVQFTQADAFAYMRDMLQNGRQYDVVILDPPKLIKSRREVDEGRKKHLDLNRLAVQLVKPGGLMLTCSCSGLLDDVEFTKVVLTAARQAGVPPAPVGAAGAKPALARPGIPVQIIAKTGAAADHPIAGDCPETEYLHAVWLRVCG